MLDSKVFTLLRCFFQDCTGSRGANAWEDTCVRLLLLSTSLTKLSYDRKVTAEARIHSLLGMPTCIVLVGP